MTDLAWIGLSLTGRIGNKTLQALLKQFNGNTTAILQADVSTLQQIQGIGPKIAQSIKAINLNEVEKAVDRWRRMGVQIWTLRDSFYPDRLKQLEDAPPTLFVRGDPTFGFERCISIVGTRSPHEEARKFAQNLSSVLVEKGFSIISGMAIGIDAAAHFGALAMPEGRNGGHFRLWGVQHLSDNP